MVTTTAPPRRWKKVMTVTCTYTPEISPRQGATRYPSASDIRQLLGSVWLLAHRPEAAGAARKIARVVLAEWGVADEAAESVLLTVSELVTNAVEHAQPPLLLELSRDPGAQRIHIEVSDGGPALTEGDWAAGCTPDEHGRGLQIIDQLTAAHGDRDEAGHVLHWADVNVAA
ncbi:ATP-binding protein [Streptomyces sp. NPDC101150]|uniref:ATP-binding protein n=1 Tax=Streptomyces sp. NPDC101150 TaxID=3366114 RepID=UPI003817E957